MGGQDDPEDGKAVASTIFTAVLVYGVRNLLELLTTSSRCHYMLPHAFTDQHQAFLVFCGLQGFLHIRESRRGAIAL